MLQRCHVLHEPGHQQTAMLCGGAQLPALHWRHCACKLPLRSRPATCATAAVQQCGEKCTHGCALLGLMASSLHMACYRRAHTCCWFGAGAGPAALLLGASHTVRRAMLQPTSMCTCTSGRSTTRAAGSSCRTQQAQVCRARAAAQLGQRGVELHGCLGVLPRSYALADSATDNKVPVAWLQLTSPSRRSSATETAAAALAGSTSCSRRASSRCGTSAHVSGVQRTLARIGCMSPTPTDAKYQLGYSH